MSYDEVERGLPPVNVVYSPLRTPRNPILPKFLSNENFDEFDDAPINDGKSRESTAKSKPSKGNRPLVPKKPKKKREVDMTVFTAGKAGPIGTFKPDEIDEVNNVDDGVSRARKYGGFVLVFLPPIFIALAVQFLKFAMDKFPLYVLAMSVCQGILWPSVFYSVFVLLTERKSIMQSLRCSTNGCRNIIELLILGIISSGAIILQILSLLSLDITVSLAITFTPLIIATLILHIHREQRFPVELVITAIVGYIGLTLIAIPSVLEHNEKYQDQLVVGISASVGSMLLTVPASLLLSRLRRKQINDCLTATFFGLVGTIMSLIIGIVMSFTMRHPEDVDSNPWKIVGLVAFIFVGTLFQLVEANFRKPEKCSMNLSRTRAGVFIFSGIWEILKHAFPGRFFFPSVFSIFGVLLLMISYLLAVSFQDWFEKKKMRARERRESTHESELYFIPWLFSTRFH